MQSATIHEGLEGVYVTRTALSEVDGEGGRLIVVGHPIEDLTGRVSFEDMTLLLKTGALPDERARQRLRTDLGRERILAARRLGGRVLGQLGRDAMSSLRTALSLLPPDATLPAIVATAAVVTAAASRETIGASELSPSPELGHAEDLLRLSLGRLVTPAQARLLDAYLVTVAEHGMNASSFAARVVASTGADRVAAVVAGVAALSGPLHGGAPGPVLDLLDRVGTPTRAGEVIAAELQAGRRIMGMGHRVYRVRDPRAFVLERALAEAQQTFSSERLDLARAVEAEAQRQLAARYPERGLKANVEFYTAVLLDSLGLPRSVFTALFACARLAGYAAHYDEQRARGRLIRPKSLYVGPKPEARKAEATP